MKNMTISEYIGFFRTLDLKSKIEVLKELTNTLNESMNRSPVSEAELSDDDFVDDLFGIWKNEENLTSDSIVDRTISDRVIDMN